MAEHCETCGQETEYNGWPNYPTWAVMLWVDNTEWLQETARSIVSLASSEYAAADTLRDWVKEESPLESAGLYTDVLGWALERVDWPAIVRALRSQSTELEEAQETEQEPEP